MKYKDITSRPRSWINLYNQLDFSKRFFASTNFEHNLVENRGVTISCPVPVTNWRPLDEFRAADRPASEPIGALGQSITELPQCIISKVCGWSVSSPLRQVQRQKCWFYKMSKTRWLNSEHAIENSTWKFVPPVQLQRDVISRVYRCLQCWRDQRQAVPKNVQYRQVAPKKV